MSAPWHGTVVAQGFVFDEALMGRARVLERLSSLWVETARLRRSGSRWYVLNVPARTVDSRRAPGAPLVWVDGRWLAAPLTPKELATIPLDAIVEPVGGALRVLRVAQLEAAHPADALELISPQVPKTWAIAPPPPPPPPTRPPPLPSTIDELIPLVAPAAPADAQPPRSWWQRLRGFLVGEAPPTAPAASPLRSFFARVFAPPTSEERSAYLEDLRRRFDARDWHEALRRALPLRRDRIAPGAPSSAGLPRRRESLSLLGTEGTSANAPPLVMEEEEFAAMRRLYQQAVDELLQQGRIDEAVYVLAKLLDDPRAAVALLEQNKRFELAAQLATLHGLSDVERVRLWLLAERRDEALKVVRATRDFEALVVALDARAPELAHALRARWTEELAARHRYVEALTVASKASVEPPEWDTWVTLAVDGGDAGAATAVALDVARHPERAAGLQARLREVLEAGTTHTAVASAEALLAHAPSAPPVMGRTVWRRLMRAASEGEALDGRLLDTLLAATNDTALIHDAVPSAARTTSRRHRRDLAPPAVRRLPVLDVALLPKRRRAEALGAAGLRIVGRDGAELRHHLVKADALVQGPVGAPVVVVSDEGHLSRVWRLDPRTFALSPWFQARLGPFARHSDGFSWAVGLEEALVFLDLAGVGPSEWWRVPSLEVKAVDGVGPLVSVSARDPEAREHLVLTFDVGAEKMLWRERAAVGCDTGAVMLDGQVARWSLESPPDDGLMPSERPPRLFLEKAGEQGLPPGQWRAQPTSAGLVLRGWQAEGEDVLLVRWSGEQVALLRLTASRVTAIRAHEGWLWVADDAGRVTELEL